MEIVRAHPPAMPDVIRGSHLDMPSASGETLHVAGWVIGAGSRPLAVEIAHGGHLLAIAPVNVPRPDVAASHPGVAGAALSGFAWPVDVRALEDPYHLQLRAILEDGSRVRVGSISVSGAEEEGSAPTGSGATRKRLVAEVEQLIQSARAGAAGPPARAAPAAAGEGGFVDGLRLEGLKVLVVGGRFGRAARLVRAAGADLVDTLDGDEDVVTLARLITAHLGVQRVFHHHGVLTESSERYDLVIVRPGPQLGVAEIANLSERTPVVVAEAAGVEVDALQRRFPAGGELKGGDSPVVIAARDEAALRSVLRAAPAPRKARG